MTQEQRELLLKDLSARLQYKLHCRVFKLNGDIKENDDILYGVVGDNVMTLKSDKDECLMYYQIKPYLRPMSSMTEEEREELEHLSDEYFGIALDKQIEELVSSSSKEGSRVLEYIASSVVVDWLNEHHFDYRGLIDKELALEAPKDMYK